MAVDVGVSVGIIPVTTGERVIKASLDNITKESAKADAATQKLANSQRKLAADANTTQAAFNKSVASLKAAENAMRAAEVRAQQLANAQNRMNEQANKGNVAFGNLKGLIAGYIGVQTIVNTIKLADQYTLINARLKDIAGSTRDASEMMGQLRTISNQTGTEISTSLSILQRLSFVREEIKATNADMVNFTSTVTKLGVISGASNEAQKAGLTQLGQALSSQYTRAEEFNSIMENIPAVGVKIAEGLGVTTGQLRQLVVEGKLLSSDVFAVLLNQTDEIAAKFEEMPMTASRGLQILKNDLGEIVNEMNNATNGASVLGRMLEGLGGIAKVLYLGLTSAFEYLVAIVMEANNGVSKLFNVAARGGAAIQNLNPFGPKVVARQVPTFEAGTIIGTANENVQARKARLDILGTNTDGVGASAQRTIQGPGGGQTYAEWLAKNGAKDKAADAAAKKAAQEQKKLQNELQSAINGSRTEMERLNDEVAHLEKLKGVAKTAKDIELLNRGIKNTQDEITKLQTKLEVDSPLVKGFKDVADEIQDGFKDAFKSAFDGGGSLFSNMANGIKKTFKSLLLDLAYQAAVKPIILSVLSAGGSALGISGNALSNVLGSGASAGGSGGLSFSNILSTGSSLLNGGLYSSTLGNFGMRAGNYLSGISSNFIGPVAPGSLGAGLGSAFGNLGYGALGGIGANLLGLGGNNAAANTILSTGGSMIGGYFGGPIGAAVGGFVGTALGGLFGGAKPSDKAQWGTLNLADLTRTGVGGQTGKKFSQENSDFRDRVLTEATNLVQLLAQGGGTTTGTLGIHIGSRDGLRLLNTNGTVAKNYGSDSTAFVTAVLQQVTKQTTGLTATFQTILNKLGVGDTTKLAEGFSFGQQYDTLLNPKGSAGAMTAAIKALDDAMKASIKTATDLGLPIEKYTIALQKQKEAAIEALKAEEANQKAQMAGFNTLADMTRAFDAFFNGQALGDTSTLTPQQKLEQAQNTFGGLLKRAQGGDLSVTQDLLSSAQTLIGQGRDVYASSVDYSNLEGFVRSSVKGVATQAGYSGQDVTYSIISTNQQLVQTGMNTNASIDAMKAEIFRLSNLLASYVSNAA